METIFNTKIFSKIFRRQNILFWLKHFSKILRKKVKESIQPKQRIKEQQLHLNNTALSSIFHVRAFHFHNRYQY